MLVYGEGGVGKTTFGSTAPKPLLLDFENGSKYLGLRGINIDAVQIKEWQRWQTRGNANPSASGTLRDAELIKAIQSDEYDTIVIDPIGEAMDKLINSVAHHPDAKMRQRDGSPTMAGWGYIKKTFRDFIKFLRDSGKHVILIGHVAEDQDENRIVKRPLIATKISQDVVNMVDIVGYMTTRLEDGEEKRVIIVDPASDKYTAKDRTGQLGSELEPDFDKIADAINVEGAWNGKENGADEAQEDAGEEETPSDEETPKDNKKEAPDAKQDAEEAPEEDDQDEEDEDTASAKDKLSKANGKKNAKKTGK